MPTFAPNYIEPGTYPEVVLEPTTPAITPAFVTALIGRTSPFGPKVNHKLRNGVADVQFEIQSDESVSVGLAELSFDTIAASMKEPPRFDMLEYFADNYDAVKAAAAIPSITSEIIDDNGMTHLVGSDNSWTLTHIGDKTTVTAVTSTKDAWFIEWIPKFLIQGSILDEGGGNVPQSNACVGVAGSGEGIELARNLIDPLFPFPMTAAAPADSWDRYLEDNPMLAPTTLAGGEDIVLDGVYLIEVGRTYAAGPGEVTWTLTPYYLPDGIGSDGIPITGTAVPGTIATCVFKVSQDATYDSTLHMTQPAVPDVTDGGTLPADFAGVGYRYIFLRTGNGWIRCKVSLIALDNAAIAQTYLPWKYQNTEFISTCITITTAGPRVGYGGSLGVVPPPGTEGTKYTVNYRYAKQVSDLKPQLFTSLNALQEVHGTIDVNTTNDSLSYGAALYFSEGGGSLYTMPLRSKEIDPLGYDLSINASFEAAVAEALIALENVADVCNVVVLSPTEPDGATVHPGTFRSQIFSNLKGHCNRMSTITEAKPRMAITGARANTINPEKFIAGGEAGLDRHMVYLAPATASVSISGKTFLADGSSIAAALAGILSNPAYNAGEPITKKQITAFASIPDPFTREDKNIIAGKGVTVIEQQLGGPTVRHFLSTDMRLVLSQEAKVMRIEIDIRRSLKIALDSTLIGTRKISGETVATAGLIVSSVLNGKKAVGVIERFLPPDVHFDAAEPRQLDIDVLIKPTLDIDWIKITATFTVS